MSTPPNTAARQLNTEDLFRIMQRVLLRDERAAIQLENFWVIGLAEDHRLLFVDWVDMNRAHNDKERALQVFSLALQKRAPQLVLCHNREERPLRVSESDRLFSDQLLQFSEILQLTVVDHLLICETEFISLQERGVLDELRQDFQYQPSHELTQHLRVEAIKYTQRRVREAKDLATRIEKLRIAKALKYNGIDESAIIIATGVTAAELGRL
jgi:DNA repair protein RadC